MSSQEGKRIRVSEFVVTPRAEQLVAQALATGRITQGALVTKFEQLLTENLDGPGEAIACASGTAALHLALLGLEIGPKDAVIVPALSYVATANAVRYVGASIFFVDVDHTGMASPFQINELATELYESGKYARVFTIVVPLYDSVIAVSAIAPWIGVIIDAAHCPLAPADDMDSPNIVAVTHSFFASKVIACGEGGAVVFRDEKAERRARLIRGQGCPVAGVYWHSEIGYNYRMTELQAAFGIAHMEEFPDIYAKRRALADRYWDRLTNFGSSRLWWFMTNGNGCAWQVAGTVEPKGVSRDRVRTRVDALGIETRPVFDPLPSLPMYGGPKSRDPLLEQTSGLFPMAYSLARRGIVLPLHTEMTDEDVDWISAALLEAIHEERLGA